MSEVKYEPIDDRQLADLVNSLTRQVKRYSGTQQLREVISAELKSVIRRIIKTPVWTKADQLASKLPEVGCKAIQIQGFCEVDVLMIHNGCVVVCNSEISDSRPAVFKIDSFMELFTPLETPEEKAQRLEDEWVDKAFGMSLVFAHIDEKENHRLREHLRAIYKAQLSGELKAPEVE